MASGIRRAAIVAPVRSAVGTFGGSLRPVPVEQLAAAVLKAVIERSGIAAGRIEDVVFAQSYANGETPCVGRWAALQAGLPVDVPGMQLDRRCGGGLQAIVTAAMMVQSGAADVVVAGGVESMSNIEYYTTGMRWGARSGSVTLHDRLERGRERSQPVERFGVITGMIETAENLAREYSITREECDAYAARSHQRAAMIVVSDGADSASDHTPTQIKRELNGTDLFVYWIAVDHADTRASTRINPFTIAEIAGQGNGYSEVIPGPERLDVALTRVSDELNHQYTMSYEPSTPANGRMHTVRVSVPKRDYVVRARRGVVR